MILDTVKEKAEQINKLINKKNHEYEKTINPTKKKNIYLELLKLESKYEAYVEIIKMIR